MQIKNFHINWKGVGTLTAALGVVAGHLTGVIPEQYTPWLGVLVALGQAVTNPAARKMQVRSGDSPPPLAL